MEGLSFDRAAENKSDSTMQMRIVAENIRIKYGISCLGETPNCATVFAAVNPKIEHINGFFVSQKIMLSESIINNVIPTMQIIVMISEPL